MGVPSWELLLLLLDELTASGTSKEENDSSSSSSSSPEELELLLDRPSPSGSLALLSSAADDVPLSPELPSSELSSSGVVLLPRLVNW